MPTALPGALSSAATVSRQPVPSPHRASAACGPRRHVPGAKRKGDESWRGPFFCGASLKPCDVTRSSTVHDSDIAQQAADVAVRIADIELRILLFQKRAANLLARGADATELEAVVAMLNETLAYLEAYKSQLHEPSGG